MRPFAGGQVAAQGTGARAVCLLGMPDDTGVGMNKGRVGAKAGPAAFRAALAGYGLALPAPPLRALPAVFDAGDIVPGATLDETHARVTEASRAIVAAGLMPVGIGGGHDLTFAFVRGVIEGLKARRAGIEPRAGVYVDAHLDVRAEAGSGMPFRALVERCGVRSLTCIGMEPLVNSAEHALWFAAHGGRAVSVREARATDPTTLIPDEPCFVSIDMDGLDAAHAPGVSAVNPCGLDPQTVAGIALAAGRSSHVACFDICELNPVFDVDGRTARLAAYLFLSFLTGFAERPA
ncbi:MAG: formimidoylglutamase [Phycisphaerales bacterium]